MRSLWPELVRQSPSSFQIVTNLKNLSLLVIYCAAYGTESLFSLVSFYLNISIPGIAIVAVDETDITSSGEIQFFS